MRPKHHAIISAIASVLFFIFSRSWSGSIMCFLAGVLIDLDHIIDYLMVNRRIPKIGEFFDYFYEKRYKRIFLFFHSVELFPVFFLVTRHFFGTIPAMGMLVGIIGHIFLDITNNSPQMFGYFLTYRILVGFKKEKIATNP